MNEIITRKQAKKIAADNLYEYLTADYGKRLVSDEENPLEAYLQEQNTRSQAEEIFSVKCPGIGNLCMSYFREGWNCDDLSDEGVLAECCEVGDMILEINALADAIYASANEGDAIVSSVENW